MAGVGLALALAARPAGAGPAAEAKADEAPAVDVTAVRDKLQVLGDGHGHFVALIPFANREEREHAYYGDGKRFHAMRVVTSFTNGHEAFSFTFWDPRFRRGVESELRFQEGRYAVTCGEHETTMTALPAEEARKLVAEASFFGPLWRWKAYALARDEQGTYYYVDRQREPADSRNFRLFSGTRGKLKRLEMTNVVSDSVGEIFVTKAGKFWLIFGKQESFWIRGKNRKGLTNVPVEDNAALIFDEVGAYAGQRLGTPCDDL
jgi:hypothetical protein